MHKEKKILIWSPEERRSINSLEATIASEIWNIIGYPIHVNLEQMHKDDMYWLLTSHTYETLADLIAALYERPNERQKKAIINAIRQELLEEVIVVPDEIEVDLWESKMYEWRESDLNYYHTIIEFSKIAHERSKNSKLLSDLEEYIEKDFLALVKDWWFDSNQSTTKEEAEVKFLLALSTSNFLTDSLISFIEERIELWEKDNQKKSTIKRNLALSIHEKSVWNIQYWKEVLAQWSKLDSFDSLLESEDLVLLKSMHTQIRGNWEHDLLSPQNKNTIRKSIASSLASSYSQDWWELKRKSIITLHHLALQLISNPSAEAITSRIWSRYNTEIAKLAKKDIYNHSTRFDAAMKIIALTEDEKQWQIENKEDYNLFARKYLVASWVNKWLETDHGLEWMLQLVLRPNRKEWKSLLAQDEKAWENHIIYSWLLPIWARTMLCHIRSLCMDIEEEKWNTEPSEMIIANSFLHEVQTLHVNSLQDQLSTRLWQNIIFNRKINANNIITAHAQTVESVMWASPEIINDLQKVLWGKREIEYIKGWKIDYFLIYIDAIISIKNKNYYTDDIKWLFLLYSMKSNKEWSAWEDIQSSRGLTSINKTIKDNIRLKKTNIGIKNVFNDIARPTLQKRLNEWKIVRSEEAWTYTFPADFNLDDTIKQAKDVLHKTSDKGWTPLFERERHS